ncbi:hypothetical protein ACF5W4_16025 [Bacillota bacterium Lsc_1132]
MNNRRKVLRILLLCLFVTTGCWDRIELNNLAIILGSGMDQTQDGSYLLSSQIAIPSKLGSSRGDGGGKDQGYFLETATGKSILDAAQNMQIKLSRKTFGSHRRDIFNMGKSGKKIFNKKS